MEDMVHCKNLHLSGDR